MYAEVEAVQRIGNLGGPVYFVDPNHARASNQNAGTHPDYPLRTVAYALTLAPANIGATIVVAWNGYWTYGDATADRYTPITEAVTVTTPGITILGVGPGTLGVPWIPGANSVACITVHALDVHIEGFNFWDGNTYTGNTGVATAWDAPDYYGENLTVERCFFYGLDYGVSLDYAWNCKILGCRFEDMGAVGIYNPSVYGEPDYLTVRGCTFVESAYGISLPDCDHCIIEGNRFLENTATIAIVNGANNQILNNAIEANPAGTNNMINLTGGANNLVSGNSLSCTIAQYDTTCSDATSGSWGGNSCANGFTTAAPT